MLWGSADASKKPTVTAYSGKTAYTVIFTPDDKINYKTISTTLTLTVNKAQDAPDMPGAALNVANFCDTVGKVTAGM